MPACCFQLTCQMLFLFPFDKRHLDVCVVASGPECHIRAGRQVPGSLMSPQGSRELEVSAQISYHHCQVFGRNSPPYPWKEKPCEKAEMTATYLDVHINFFLLFFSTPLAGNSLFLILLFSPRSHQNQAERNGAERLFCGCE